MLCVDPTMEQSTDVAPAASAAGTLERLLKQWPGREQHITQLYEHLAAHTARRPLLIYGGAATGKSALIRCCPAHSDHLPPRHDCSVRDGHIDALTSTTASCMLRHMSSHRSLLQARRQHHAYVNAMETAKPKAITRSILEQLTVRHLWRGPC